jgi:hypothetical protein
MTRSQSKFTRTVAAASGGGAPAATSTTTNRSSAPKGKAKYLKVGSILKRKGSDDTYIKFEHAIPAGSYVNIEDPRTLPDKLLSEGKISEEIYNKMTAREIPDFVVCELTMRVENSDE